MSQPGADTSHDDTSAARVGAAPASSAVVPNANPAPLGLAAFALTTMVLSCVNAGWINAGTETIVIGVALFYGGLVQLAAGMWEFHNKNTFGAVAFSSYGGFWISFAGILFFFKPGPGVTTAGADHAIAVYLLGWTIFTLYMTIAALRTSGAVLAVFAFLTVTYLLLALGLFTANTELGKIGGYLGIVTAIAAWYASAAEVTNATWKRIVLPTWPAA